MKLSDWLQRAGIAFGISGLVLAFTGIAAGKDGLWVSGIVCFPASIITSMMVIPVSTREFKKELKIRQPSDAD
jgi:hypothetical protein